jgi:hypothetical protein
LAVDIAELAKQASVGEVVERGGAFLAEKLGVHAASCAGGKLRGSAEKDGPFFHGFPESLSEVARFRVD